MRVRQRDEIDAGDPTRAQEGLDDALARIEGVVEGSAPVDDGDHAAGRLDDGGVALPHVEERHAHRRIVTARPVARDEAPHAERGGREPRDDQPRRPGPTARTLASRAAAASMSAPVSTAFGRRHVSTGAYA